MFGVASDCHKTRRWRLLENLKIRAAMLMAVLALVLIWTQLYVLHDDGAGAGYCAGLVTELLGVAITILVIDIVLERQELRRDVRRLADELLYQADFIVWIWLGGDRVFSLAELECLLESVSDDDALHHTTETLFQNLGNEAAKRMRTHKDVVDSNIHLCDGVRLLAQLANIRVGSGASRTTPSQIGEIVSGAVRAFDKVLCYRETEGAANGRYLKGKRSDVAAQRFRCSGEC